MKRSKKDRIQQMPFYFRYFSYENGVLQTKEMYLLIDDIYSYGLYPNPTFSNNGHFIRHKRKGFIIVKSLLGYYHYETPFFVIYDLTALVARSMRHKVYFKEFVFTRKSGYTYKIDERHYMTKVKYNQLITENPNYKYDILPFYPEKQMKFVNDVVINN